MIFDYDIAMNYLGNNKNLFFIVVKSFLDSYSNFEEKIKMAVESTDVEELHSLVHSLKGITLNLGCVDLHEKCTKMLPNLKNGQFIETDVDHLIKIYNNSYQELFNKVA